MQMRSFLRLERVQEREEERESGRGRGRERGNMCSRNMQNEKQEKLQTRRGTFSRK